MRRRIEKSREGWIEGERLSHWYTSEKGHNVYDSLAPIVISDAGLTNTVKSLLPEGRGDGRMNKQECLSMLSY